MLTSTNNFWSGFLKGAALIKGERADKPEGVRPRTLIASKGRVDPEPLPSADNNATVHQHLKAELKLKTIPRIRRDKM